MPAPRKLKPEPKPAMLTIPAAVRKPPTIVPQVPTPKQLEDLLKAAKLPAKPIYVVQHKSGHIRAFWYNPYKVLVCQFINTQLTSVFPVDGQLLGTIRDSVQRGDTKTLMGRCPKELL